MGSGVLVVYDGSHVGDGFEPGHETIHRRAATNVEVVGLRLDAHVGSRRADVRPQGRRAAAGQTRAVGDVLAVTVP